MLAMVVCLNTMGVIIMSIADDSNEVNDTYIPKHHHPSQSKWMKSLVQCARCVHSCLQVIILASIKLISMKHSKNRNQWFIWTKRERNSKRVRWIGSVLATRRLLVMVTKIADVPNPREQSHPTRVTTFDSDSMPIMVDNGASACITNGKISLGKHDVSTRR